LIVICFKTPLHFLEDCGIFCEGEYQVKDDGYAIVKQQSANIPDAGDKQQQSIISNVNTYDERQHKKKDGKAIIDAEAVELTISFGDLSLINSSSSSAFLPATWWIIRSLSASSASTSSASSALASLA
jgi:hypothetical protein